MKVVINKRYGGFGLSYKACMRYAELKGFTLYPFMDRIEDGIPDLRHFVQWDGKGKQPYWIHYSTSPLDKNGRYEEESYWSDDSVKRNDPVLIQVVEELGDEANGEHAKLEIVEIPDGVECNIEEYDGNEWVSEEHRTWG